MGISDERWRTENLGGCLSKGRPRTTTDFSRTSMWTMFEDDTWIALSLVGSLVACVCATPSPASEPTTARLEIVDRAIEFHGGTRYERSDTNLRMCSKSGCYEIRARVDEGQFLYDVAAIGRSNERRVVWTNDSLDLLVGGVSRAVEANRVQALRDWAMARVYFCFLPFRLNDESVLKEDLGLETWGGRNLHKVKVTFEAGSSSGADDEYLYWFEPESGRLQQFAYSFSGDPGGLRFRRATRFRRVGDILFFDQENMGVDGDGLAVDQIDPGFVSQMKRISTVELSRIRVEALD